MLCLFCWSAWHFGTIDSLSAEFPLLILCNCAAGCVTTSCYNKRSGWSRSLTAILRLFSACRGVYCKSLSHWGWIRLSFGIQHSHYEMTWFPSELWIWFKLVDRRSFFVWSMWCFQGRITILKAFIWGFQTGWYQPPRCSQLLFLLVFVWVVFHADSSVEVRYSNTTTPCSLLSPPQQKTSV